MGFNRSQHTLLPYQKIEILYEHKIHGLFTENIASKFGIARSTAGICITQFNQNGRMYNLLSRFAKDFLLKHRQINVEHQRLYKIFLKR